jgi:hypothetical protein
MGWQMNQLVGKLQEMPPLREDEKAALRSLGLDPERKLGDRVLPMENSPALTPVELARLRIDQQKFEQRLQNNPPR